MILIYLPMFASKELTVKTYLVGGAVRDALLGLAIKDRDWVVVGSTPEAMTALGYQTVGQDFPVFLHPKTKEEFALARTERKAGRGYKGFTCYSSPDVTLEQDLIRRDLTINAIAQDKNGQLIDPYNGLDDLKQRVLRHVSSAFVEDPLRVLRVARFAARFHHLGFTIADETIALMGQIVTSGELSELTAERVWQEWQKSLSYDNPQQFLTVLRQCGALRVVLPEIDALYGVPQPKQWHPEIDTGIHTVMVAQQAALLSPHLLIRFASQMHDLGKALTPKEILPSHKMHEQRGLDVIKQLCKRVKVPNEYRDLALIVCEHHTNIHHANELKATTFIKLFDKMDAWRKPERVEQLVLCCTADFKGRTGFEHKIYSQADTVRSAFKAALSVEVKQIVASGFTGADIRVELTKQRVEAIKRCKLAL